MKDTSDNLLREFVGNVPVVSRELLTELFSQWATMCVMGGVTPVLCISINRDLERRLILQGTKDRNVARQLLLAALAEIDTAEDLEG